jgi:hypothetical protein
VITLDEKVHRIGGPAEKRGAPADKARAFDKVNPKTGARPSRSMLKKLEMSSRPEFFALDVSEDPDYTMVLVLRSGVDDPEYYGVNVLFYPDGKVDAATGDAIADKQWKDHRAEIIRVAKGQLKSGAPMGDTDADVRAYHGAGDGDYSGYMDKKMNEDKMTFKQFLLAEVKKVKEPGWYVCDHMDKPVSGPMQERGAKEEAEEKNAAHAAKHGKGDIPPFSAEYFSDYDIKRMTESFGEGERDLTRSQKAALLKDFEGWSGGFTPDDCTAAQVREYLAHGISTKIPAGPAKKYLDYIRDNGASNAP